MATRFLRVTLLVAAIMTAFGAWLFAMPHTALALQYGLPTDVPVVYKALVSFVLALFAVMYALMAFQSSLVRPLLWLGIAGKGGAFIMVLVLFLLNHVPASTVTLLSGDAVLSATWLGWLYKNGLSNRAST